MAVLLSVVLKWMSLSPRYNSDNMNGIKAVDLQPGSEAYKEEIQLPHTDVSVSLCVCVWVCRLKGTKATESKSEP